MKFRALKDLPNGVRSGDIFDATEDAGAILMLPEIAAAEKVVAHAKAIEAEKVVEPEKPARGRYRRSDLRADAPDTTSDEG